MLTTANPEWAVRLRRLREHGMSVSAADRHASSGVKLEEYEEVGFNFRMTDIQAAIGLIQLAKLPEVITRRRELAERYHKLLAEIDGLCWVTDPEYGTTNYQSFWVLLTPEFGASRDEALAALAAAGVSARRGIMAAHLEPAYEGYPFKDLRNTERLTRDSLILPLHHAVTADDQQYIVDVLRGLRGA